VPSVIIDIIKVILDITTKYSGSLYRDTGRRCVRQSIIRLKAIGIFY
jgi:hypothetical protein